jgi:uncharacterized protein YcgI (DUF1989 family)
MIRINRRQIKPRTGTAFTVKKDQVIRIIDVEGQQVSDLVCFAQRDIEESLSSGRTIDYNEKIFLSTGDILYSHRSNPMLAILADCVGKHDLLFAPCSQEMFRLSYNVTDPHPNCLENLATHLDPFGIKASHISTSFNIFMNVRISEHCRITIQPPISKAGDYIDLRAEMDLIIGITACSAEKCNNYHCSAIAVEVYGQF